MSTWYRNVVRMETFCWGWASQHNKTCFSTYHITSPIGYPHCPQNVSVETDKVASCVATLVTTMVNSDKYSDFSCSSKFKDHLCEVKRWLRPTGWMAERSGGMWLMRVSIWNNDNHDQLLIGLSIALVYQQMQQIMAVAHGPQRLPVRIFEVAKTFGF